MGQTTRLPDERICLTKLYFEGERDAYQCLVDNSHICNHLINFGLDFNLCIHPQRAKLTESGEALQSDSHHTTP
jgi:hypothetical protein